MARILEHFVDEIIEVPKMQDSIPKTVLILRGLPGQGKSTFARFLLSTWIHSPLIKEASICSADDFFTDSEGNYNFDPDKIHLAHKSCKERFERCIEYKEQVIVVDNTNTRRSEYKFYKERAKANGYQVFEITVGSLNVDKSEENNIHGVPREALERMAKRFQLS